MNIKINPYKAYISNNSNAPITQPYSKSQNYGSLVGFCGKDEFVSKLIRKEAMPISDAFSYLLKMIKTSSYKEINLPLVNPEPSEIRLYNLSLNAKKLDSGDLSFEIAYVNPNAKGYIPIPTDSLLAIENKSENKTLLTESVKQSLIDESDNIRYDKTSRMDD